MTALTHHEFHAALNAEFGELKGCEVVSQYSDIAEEYRYLTESAGILDLSFRGRICALGDDRSIYLHGQLTNDIKRLQAGQGCYSAVCTPKGRFQSDLHVHCLENEILLDFEPGLTELVTERLNKNIVADDVELCDIAPHFGLLSIQGPKASAVITSLDLGIEIPSESHSVTWIEDSTLGQIYLVNNARLGSSGWDLYADQDSIPAIADKLIAAARQQAGGPVGWNAFETARIAAGIPRFGQDMSDANLVPETGVSETAISYQKGCYIGQEVLNRLRTFAEVSKTLRRIEFPETEIPPAVGATIELNGKSVGKLTSITIPPGSQAPLALGYVHKSANEAGTQLQIGEHTVHVANLPA